MSQGETHTVGTGGVTVARPLLSYEMAGPLAPVGHPSLSMRREVEEQLDDGEPIEDVPGRTFEVQPRVLRVWRAEEKAAEGRWLRPVSPLSWPAAIWQTIANVCDA